MNLVKLRSFEFAPVFEMHIDDVCNKWLNHTKLMEWLHESQNEDKEYEIVFWFNEEGYDYKMEFQAAEGHYLSFILTYTNHHYDEYTEVPEEYLRHFDRYTVYEEEDDNA